MQANDISGHNVSEGGPVETTNGPEAEFLKKQFTLEEFNQEIQEYREGKLGEPDPEDFEDPLYYRKYAHTLPPLESYFIVPDDTEKQNKTMKTNNDRKVYYGWNNLTKFEEQGIENLKKNLAEKKGVQLPPGYDDRDLLKFCQANFFDIEKASTKIIEHFKWLSSLPPEPRLTPMTIRLLQSGCFYIHGRDKNYRPAFIMDANLMAKLNKEQPEILTVDVFQDLFCFLYVYLRQCMLLPG